jgi:type IV pilus assembly protein PilB
VATLLLERGLVSQEQVDVALAAEAEGKSVGDALVDSGAVSERDMVLALGERLGVTFIDLRRETPEADAVALLPEPVARDMCAIPIRRTDGGVLVAVSDPTAEVRQALTNAMKTTPEMVLAPATDIDRAINNAYRAIDNVSRLVDAFTVAEASRKTSTAQQEVLPDDAPVVRVVNLLISQAVRDRTSDIHIEPYDDEVRIRYRIDGALHQAVTLPGNMGPAVISRIKIMSGLNIVERRKPQDGQISAEIDGRMLDIRVNTTPTIFGEKAVLRLLDRKRTLLKLDHLGMPPDIHKTYSSVVRSPWGMVVCAGPTGCGKTTTLYATLNEINDPKANITTIEDPVEFVFPSITQIQINDQAGMTFAGGLRAILRQDPDVILVGEIRDVETARLATQAALTGHFVLSSIHATDSSSALHRFVDMGIERFLIASALSMVVSQRLLRRICKHCRVRTELTVDEKAFFETFAGEGKTEFWKGEGCNFCANTGYVDRIGVYELLHVTDEIRQLVLDNAVHEEIKKMAISQGMSTLLDEGLKLVRNDVTTVSEVMRHVYAM